MSVGSGEDGVRTIVFANICGSGLTGANFASFFFFFLFFFLGGDCLTVCHVFERCVGSPTFFFWVHPIPRVVLPLMCICRQGHGRGCLCLP